MIKKLNQMNLVEQVEFAEASKILKCPTVIIFANKGR
jgi:hypothetical protein